MSKRKEGQWGRRCGGSGNGRRGPLEEKGDQGSVMNNEGLGDDRENDDTAFCPGTIQ